MSTKADEDKEEEPEIVRDTLEIGTDGRLTVQEPIRKVVGIFGMKAYCQIENYGKNKILITILNRWKPTDGPGRDVVRK
jgi:hypothetical protein